MTYIYQITLNTGNGIKQYRAGVPDDVVTVLHDMFDPILQGNHVDVPGSNGYTINGTAVGRNLITTVWSGDTVPILTMGTALKSRSALQLWCTLHDSATLPMLTNRDDPPRVPWQADRLEIGALDHGDAFYWTGDFSRCLAWAWLEYRGDQ